MLYVSLALLACCLLLLFVLVPGKRDRNRVEVMRFDPTAILIARAEEEMNRVTIEAFENMTFAAMKSKGYRDV